MSTVEQVRELVHRLDELEAQRKQLTAKIDSEIRICGRQLEELVGGNGTAEQARRRGRPGRGYGERLLDFLKDNPGAETGALAIEVYGKDDQQAKHHVRALLHGLKRRGAIIPMKGAGPGRWQVNSETTTAG